jgi:hypothetical protein
MRTARLKGKLLEITSLEVMDRKIAAFQHLHGGEQRIEAVHKSKEDWECNYQYGRGGTDRTVPPHVTEHRQGHGK